MMRSQTIEAQTLGIGRRRQSVGREAIVRHADGQGRERDDARRTAARLTDVLRLGLALVVVEDQAEIRAPEDEPGRVPIDCGRIVGDGDEGAAHAGGLGADSVKGLSQRRNRGQKGDNECDYGARQRPAHRRQLSVPSEAIRLVPSLDPKLQRGLRFRHAKGRNLSGGSNVFSCSKITRCPCRLECREDCHFPTTMTNPSTDAGAPVAPMGLLARFVGIITTPRETFQNVAAHPRWFWMLVLVTVIIAAGVTLPMTTEAGRQAALDNKVRQMENFGMQVTDEMYAKMPKDIRDVATYRRASASSSSARSSRSSSPAFSGSSSRC